MLPKTTWVIPPGRLNNSLGNRTELGINYKCVFHSVVFSCRGKESDVTFIKMSLLLRLIFFTLFNGLRTGSCVVAVSTSLALEV